MLNLRTSLVHFLLLSRSQLHRQINTLQQFNFPAICCDLRVNQLHHRNQIFLFFALHHPLKQEVSGKRGKWTEVSGKDRVFSISAADLLWSDFAFTQGYFLVQLYLLLYRQFLSLLFFLLYPENFSIFFFWLDRKYAYWMHFY